MITWPQTKHSKDDDCKLTFSQTISFKGNESIKDGWYSLDLDNRQLTDPLTDTTEFLKLEKDTLVIATIAAVFTDDATKEVVKKEDISFAINILVPKK